MTGEIWLQVAQARTGICPVHFSFQFVVRDGTRKASLQVIKPILDTQWGYFFIRVVSVSFFVSGLTVQKIEPTVLVKSLSIPHQRDR